MSLWLVTLTCAVRLRDGWKTLRRRRGWRFGVACSVLPDCLRCFVRIVLETIGV